MTSVPRPPDIFNCCSFILRLCEAGLAFFRSIAFNTEGGSKSTGFFEKTGVGLGPSAGERFKWRRSLQDRKRNKFVRLGKEKIHTLSQYCKVCQRDVVQKSVFKSVEYHLHHRVTLFHVNLRDCLGNVTGGDEACHIAVAILAATINKNVGDKPHPQITRFGKSS